ncbi:hypothetical protein [Pelagibacterium xiamenense]|uniref:hypothetical protein n=1 Tax=Pelagibacterium xiamenense TaxID=2901140 RepID=UPI001E32615F|nr:hypothetical protein [Pelagibacterium xiamenense]MCD7059139.1 hypothetical protein [Pelagibacterium xiamenense]
MTDPFANPFAATDADRRAIWEMLVPRDIDAFLSANWSMVADDFVAEGFIGIDGRRAPNPDDWRLGFPSLDAYRDEWLRQAADFAQQEFAEDPRAAIFATTNLTEIEIAGDLALAHKKFNGGIKRADGGYDEMRWQTLYYCRRHEERWKISGFTGYMPYPMGGGSTTA